MDSHPFLMEDPMFARKTMLPHIAAAFSVACLAGASSAHAATIADFTTDVGEFAGGFGPGWFNGGVFNSTVASGWDDGDYDWQLSQQIGTADVSGFNPGSLDFTQFSNAAGIWDSTPGNISYRRSSSPVQLSTDSDDLAVIVLTFDVLTGPVQAEVVTNFGASGGGDLDYQVFLNGASLGDAVNVSASAEALTSSSFELSQGDVLYFVADAAGSQASDLRGINITVQDAPAAPVIPEPASVALVGLGGLAMLTRRRCS